MILPECGPEGQERLAAARVLLVGLGGLGSPAALYLAAAGVGTLGLADHDVVELHNLHRQILHDEPSLGDRKIDSARRRLGDLNSGITLVDHPEGITPDNARQRVAAYDLVVDGSDNFPTRFLVNDACHLEGRPLVHGSILRFEGFAGVFNRTPESPCYRCLFPEIPAPGSVPSCAEAGVFGALCGTVGSHQAMEAIKLILGIGVPLDGRLLRIDALDGTSRALRVKKDPDCPLCGSRPSITGTVPDAYDAPCAVPPEADAGECPLEITVADLARAKKRPVLIDVREPLERDICALPDSRLIPVGEIPGRTGEIPRGEPLVLYCHHGMRSLWAARFLRERGWTRASSLKGGIDAWSREVDPTVPRY